MMLVKVLQLLPLIILNITGYNKVLCFSNNYTIIIVGAGPSGTAAASRLLENNFTDILVLEAEDRIGGRVYTRQFGSGLVEMGAQWCHGRRENIVYELLSKYDLLIDHGFDNHQLLYSSGDHLDKEFQNQLMAIMLETYYGENKDAGNSSAESYFLPKYREVVKETFRNDSNKLKVALESTALLANFIRSSEGAFYLSDVIAKSDYQEIDIVDYYINGTGYKIIFDVLIKKYPDPTKTLPFYDKLLLNKEVSKISWNDITDNVILEVSDGSVYKAKYVIFTPSVGVLKHNHKEMFIPQLPQSKQEAISLTGFDAVVKVLLYFEDVWWKEDDKDFYFLWSTEDRETIAKSNEMPWVLDFFCMLLVPNNPKVFITWVANERVPQFERLSDEELIKGITATLEKFLGDKYNVTKPEKITRSRWYSNPHFRGTYSYQTLAARESNPSAEEILAQPLKNSANNTVLLFAGEATNPIHYSTVHGAIESGYREADRIIDLLKK